MTRVILAALGLWFVLSLSASEGSTTAANFVVAGTVVRAGSHQPLRKVTVTIALVDRPQERTTVVTSEDGQFRFLGLPAAKYALSVTQGNWTRQLGQDGRFATQVVAGPGRDSGHILFPMEAPASLEVKISDEEGDPASQANVALFHKTVSGGRKQLLLVRRATSDEEGICRFTDLESGTYFVAGRGIPWYAQANAGPDAPSLQVGPSPNLDMTFPLTYYSSAPAISEADPLELRQSEAVHIELGLRAVPALTLLLGGKIYVPGSAPHPTPSIAALGPNGIPLETAAAFFETADGHAAIRGLAPGDYLVSLLEYGGAVSSGAVSGSAIVRLHESGQQLARSAFSTITVTGALHGPERGLIVEMQPLVSGAALLCPAADNGIFSCAPETGATASILPGRYAIRLANAHDVFIKSVTAQGASSVDGIIDVLPGASVQLQIEAEKGLTKITGVATKNGKPTVGATVLLAPFGADQQTGILRNQSNTDGSFQIAGVPPGRYYLLAIDNGRGLAYYDPKELTPYLSHARQLEAPAAAQTPIRLNSQPRR